MRRFGYVCVVAASLLLLGCLGGTAQASDPAPKPAAAHASGAADRLPVKVGPVPPLNAKPGSPGVLPTAPVLAPEVNGGVISRASLKHVLSAGIGRFLRQVRTEPHLRNGRFMGWRVLSLFAGKPEMQGSVLRPGDTVLRANGQSLERPEEFKSVWDGLATAQELIVEIERAGRRSKIRFTIAD